MKGTRPYWYHNTAYLMEPYFVGLYSQPVKGYNYYIRHFVCFALARKSPIQMICSCKQMILPTYIFCMIFNQNDENLGSCFKIMQSLHKNHCAITLQKSNIFDCEMNR